MGIGRIGRIVWAGLATAGVAALVAQQGGFGDGVREGAPRFDTNLQLPKGGQWAPVAGSFSYLEPLPEPADAPAMAKKTLASRAAEPAEAPSAPRPEPMEKVAEEEPPVCAAGTRPIGDCNCYDENLGKVSRKLHPSKACLNEESKRLGHQVVLTDGNGKYELVGEAPRPSFNPNAAARGPASFSGSGAQAGTQFFFPGSPPSAINAAVLGGGVLAPGAPLQNGQPMPMPPAARLAPASLPGLSAGGGGGQARCLTKYQSGNWCANDPSAFAPGSPPARLVGGGSAPPVMPVPKRR